MKNTIRDISLFFFFENPIAKAYLNLFLKEKFDLE